MFISELNVIFRSIKGKIAISLIFLLPAVDFFQHIYGEIIAYGEYDSSNFNHPVYCSFLSASSMGNFTQILMFWILPLYFMILYCDSYTSDRNSGYLKCLISRTGRKKYYKTKFKIAFFLPFILMFISLTLNFLMCIIIFHNGDMFGGFEDFYLSMDRWLIFGIEHPFIYYFIYVIADCLIGGLCGILGMCCSILFANHFKAYPISFFVWFLQILIPFGIGNTVQPYTEYGIKYFISGLCILVVSILILFAITYFVRLIKDEI